MPRCGWCAHYCDLTLPKSATHGTPLIVGVCVRDRDAGDVQADVSWHEAMDEACDAWVAYDPDDPECWEEE